MKYFTKEWHDRKNLSDLYLDLNVDERADVFSEEFYQYLYETAKNEFANNKVIGYEDYYNLTKSLYPKKNDEDINAEYEMLVKPFLNFDEHLTLKIKRLQSNLPTSILEKIKDIRVLALGYVSFDGYNIIKDFCEENKRFVEEVMNKYLIYINETFKDSSLEFLNESFHDTDIIGVKMIDNDLEIILDNIDASTDKSSIIFKNGSLVYGEICEDYYWLYDEIYKVNDKYEVHVLTSCDDVLEFIILCDDIILN